MKNTQFLLLASSWGVSSFLLPLQMNQSKAQKNVSVQWALLSSFHKNALSTRSFEAEEQDIKKQYDKKWIQNASHNRVKPSTAPASGTLRGPEGEREDAKATLSPEALTELGFCYDCGKGVPQNNERAFQLYTLAAQRGCAKAQLFLGYCHEHGNGTTVDRTKAFEHYQQAALLGNTDAHFKLGVCFQYGFGVAPDLAKAVASYKLASGQLLTVNPRITRSLAVLTATNYLDWLQHQKSEEDEEQRIKQRYDTVWYKARNKKNQFGHIRHQIAKEIYAAVIEFPEELTRIIAEYAYSFMGKLVTTVRAHASRIEGLVALPDGSFASAGATDDSQAIKIWKTAYDLEGNMVMRCIQILPLCSRPLYTLAAFPTGVLASGHSDGSIATWIHKIAPNGTKQWNFNNVFRAHHSIIFAIIALSPEIFVSSSGASDYVAHRDEMIKIWESTLNSSGDTVWNCSQILKDHGDCVTALAALRDGFASASYDKTIKIWTTALPGDNCTWYCAQTLNGHTSRVLALVCLDDGSLASAAHDYTIRIWSSTTEHHKITWHCSQVLNGDNGGHKDVVWNLVKLSTGTLISYTGDCSIKVWEPSVGINNKTTSQCLKKILESDFKKSEIKTEWYDYDHCCIRSFMALPNGELLIGFNVSSRDGIIRIFE